MSCYKCQWLGIMAPCPHADEPFPILLRPQRHCPVHWVLDVVRHIELGTLDDGADEAVDSSDEVAEMGSVDDE